MRLRATVYLVELNMKVFQKALNEHMQEQTIEAANSWLRTVIPMIPVWSRASRATFDELARAVGYNINIGPKRSNKDRMLLGMQEGRGGVDFKRKYQWAFYYKSTLRYLNWNEYHHAVKGDGSGVFFQLRNPGPYRFQKAGVADFLSFAKNVRLPNPIKFIRAKKI